MNENCVSISFNELQAEMSALSSYRHLIITRMRSVVEKEKLYVVYISPYVQ